MITLYIGKPKKEIRGEFVILHQETLGGFFDSVASPSLFGDKKNFIIKINDDDLKKTILDEVEILSQGAHDISIIVDKLLVPEIKKVEKFVTVIKNEAQEKKQNDTSAFNLANSFATGDKKKTWVTFHEVTYHDDEIEKTHGMIWWKLKDMMMKRSVFSSHQLRDMARSLVAMYHDARLGEEGIKNKLEHFFLTMPDIKK